jgi:HEPN domain-containing protein
MPRDPERVADARAWLAKARLDLRSARVDLGAEPPIVSDALFHCQQAVEKGLKAFLAWHDVAFRKTHDLGELGRQCVAINPTLEPDLRAAAGSRSTRGASGIPVTLSSRNRRWRKPLSAWQRAWLR